MSNKEDDKPKKVYGRTYRRSYKDDRRKKRDKERVQRSLSSPARKIARSFDHAGVPNYVRVSREWMKYRGISATGEGVRCEYCKELINWKADAIAGDVDGFTIDHKNPVAHGGTNDLDNIVAACRQCNREKSDRTVEQYMEYLEKRKAGLKWCRQCQRYLEKNKFTRNSTKLDGLQSNCSECGKKMIRRNTKKKMKKSWKEKKV